jgi:uncharacterized protein (TIGR02598 family)
MILNRIHAPVRSFPSEKSVTIRAHRRSPRTRKAFSLVEVALAVGVTSFCLLTLIALLPTGLRSADAASRQSVAVNLGNGIFTDLKTTAAYASANSITSSYPATTRYGLNIPTTAGTTYQYALYLDNNGNSVPAASAQFLAVLTLMCPNVNPGPNITTGAGLPKPAVIGPLVITWPAAANPSFSTNQITATGTPTASSDLRAQLKNYNGIVEMAGTVDLEQ